MYVLCAMMISLEVCKLEVYILCVMMISLEVWRFGSLHIVCDVDKFGSSEVYTLCVTMISLEVWKFAYCV